MTPLTTLSPPEPSIAEQIERRNRRLMDALGKRCPPEGPPSATGSPGSQPSVQTSRQRLLKHLIENSDSSQERALLLSSQATVAIQLGQHEAGTLLRKQASAQWPDNFHLAQDTVGDALRSGNVDELECTTQHGQGETTSPRHSADAWIDELIEPTPREAQPPALDLKQALRRLSESISAESTNLDSESLKLIANQTAGSTRTAITVPYAAVLSEHGQTQQAVEALTCAQRDAPKEPIIALYAYTLLAKQRDYDGACEALQTTLEALPSGKLRDGLLRLLAHTALYRLRNGKRAVAAIEQQTCASGSSHRLALRIRSQGVPNPTQNEVITRHLQQWELRSENRHRIIASAALAVHLRRTGKGAATQPQFDFLKGSEIGRRISDFCIRLTSDKAKTEPSFSQPPPPTDQYEALAQATFAAMENNPTIASSTPATEFELLARMAEEGVPKSPTILQLWIDQALPHGTPLQILSGLNLWQQSLEDTGQSVPTLCATRLGPEEPAKLDLIQKRLARHWTPVDAAELLLHATRDTNRQETLTLLCERNQGAFKALWLRYRARLCETTVEAATELAVAACAADKHSAAQLDLDLLLRSSGSIPNDHASEPRPIQLPKTANEQVIARLRHAKLGPRPSVHPNHPSHQKSREGIRAVLQQALSLTPDDPILSGLLRRSAHALPQKPLQTHAQPALPRPQRQSQLECFFIKLNLATTLEFSGQHDGAIALYRQILERNPQEFIARSGLRRCLVRSGRKAELRRQIADEIQSESTSAGRNRALCEWLDQAAGCRVDIRGPEISTVLERSPNHIPALRLLARNASRHGHPEDLRKAAARLSHCLNSASDRTTYLQLQLRLRDPTADPEERDLILLSAKDRIERNTPFVCLGLEAAARRRDLNSLTVIALVGQARCAEHPLEQASLAIAAARALMGPSEPPPRTDSTDGAEHANLAAVLKTIQNCSDSLDSHPTLAEELARIHLVLGDRQSAAEALRRASGVCHGTARSRGFLYYAASLQESLGERQASIALFRELVHLDPNHDDASVRLEQLLKLEQNADSRAKSTDKA